MVVPLEVVEVVAAEAVAGAAEVNMNQKKITFQWHITDVCNYRCKHCYQDAYSDIGLPYHLMIGILDKMEIFVSQLSVKFGKVKGHINFTGGEPFLQSDFIPLIEEVSRRNIFSFAILSNGFLLPDNELIRLVASKPSFIQISLDGDEEMNDSIRGKGSFKDVIHALKKYNKLKIPVLISFTANAKNFRLFSVVVNIARKHKVQRVWSDRYLPSADNDELQLNTGQVQEFFSLMAKEKVKSRYHIFSKTFIVITIFVMIIKFPAFL